MTRNISIKQPDRFGNQIWYLNGKIHRIVGPAIIYSEADGQKDKWYLNGYDKTDEVGIWMEENIIEYPFNEETQMLFLMKFL